MKTSARLLLLVCIALLTSACQLLDETYDKTYHLIEPNKKITRLDLSASALTHLPIEISALTELQYLNLSNNPDLEWSETFVTLCQLPKLKTLVLENNELSVLDSNIQHCNNLQGISLAKNKELNFANAFETLSGLPINFVNLSNNDLSTLPQQIEQLSVLVDLRLSGNHITHPNAFKPLAKSKHLFTLWLDNNALTEIPESLYLLRQLHYLYLDHNQLTFIPNKFVYMRVSAAWLGHNKFESVPDNVARSTVLMAFLNNNQINKMGAAVDSGKFNIRGIILDHNALDEEQVNKAERIFKETFIFQADNQIQESHQTP